jgi:subtilisin family serine protease
LLSGGFLYTHEDLADNIWINGGETGIDENGIDRSINGVDDDLNGYVDDLHGYDFAFSDPDPDNINYDGKDIYRLQPYWHGTSVAGIIGAKNLDLSLNFEVPASLNMSNLVKVTEIGFSGYLVSYVTVRGDTLGSCFWKKSVTIGAIGENYTTWDYHSRPYYALGAGTSCAGPIVAGCAALMLSVNPDLSPSEIREILIGTATPLESLKGITESGGAVNIYGAVKKAIDMKTSAQRENL